MAVHKKHEHLHTKIFRSFEGLSTFEKAVTIFASIDPIASIPQVYKVYSLQSAEELSLFSWIFGLGTTLLWLTYAITKRSLPLICSSFLWMCVYVSIVTAIFLYG